MPPPIGGVSTFMRRHVAQLERDGVPHSVRDWTKMSGRRRLAWMLRLLLDPRHMHVEFNAYETWTMVAVVLRPWPAHVLLRVHSGGPESRLNSWQKWIFARFLRGVDQLVLVGAHVESVLRTAGYLLPDSWAVQPAFLPPPPEDRPSVLATYGESGRRFLDAHHPLLVLQGSNAFRDGVDLYGSDMAVDALIALRTEFPRLGLVVGRPTRGGAAFEAYCAGLDRRLAAAGASNHMWILDGERELWPVIERADVYLRPTLSDGDSIGVREALHLGTAVVASDAAPRPAGVRTFVSRDQQAFNEAIRRALSDAEQPRASACS
ncbi:MAG: glycosyltransferase [Rhodothermales bacterium]|nr:glycosyltransferase [Rhodothermales bacterium]MBO6780754.1 glycosyltransferase [Rhodothermales bacterium]